MTSICLLGGTGYIGQYLEKSLKDKGYDVHSIARSTKLSYQDFLSESKASFDIYVHLIGNSSDHYFNKPADYTVNYDSVSESLRRFENDEGAKRFIFFSTLYTQIKIPTEGLDLSPYVMSKRTAEKVITEFSNTSSKSYSIFRPAVVFNEPRGLLGVFAKLWSKGVSLRIGGEVGVPLVHLDQILEELHQSIATDKEGIEIKNLISSEENFLSTHNKPEILGFAKTKPRLKLFYPFWLLSILAAVGHALKLPFNKYFLLKLTSYSHLVKLKDE